MAPKHIIQRIDVLIDDDINIVVDVLKKTKATQVIVKLPEGNDLLTSRVGLKLLLQSAKKLEKKIVIQVSTATSYDFVGRVGLPIALDEVQAMAILKGEKISPVLRYLKTASKSSVLAGGVASVGKKSLSDSKTKSTATLSSIKKLTKGNKNKVLESKDSFIGYDFAQREHIAPVKEPVVKKKTTPISSKIFVDKKSSSSFLLIVLSVLFFPLKVLFRLLVGFVWKVLVLVLIVGIIGFVIYYKYFPTVNIILTIASEEATLQNIDVKAKTSLTGFDLKGKQVQLLVEEITNKGSVSITASEEKIKGDLATGIVTLFNNSTEVVALTGKTVVTANSLQFTINNAIELPAGVEDPVSAELVPGEAEVGVTAIKFGENYNLVANTTFSLPDYTSVVAQNKADFAGGNTQTDIVIGEKDVKKGVTELTKSVQQENIGELEFLHQGDGFVYIPTSVVHQKNVKPKVDPEVGTNTTEAYLEIELKTTAYYYHRSSVNKLGQQLLQQDFVKKQEIENFDSYETSNDSVEITKITFDKKNKVATIKINVKAQVIPKIDEVELAKQIHQKQWIDLSAFLTSYVPNLAREPEVIFRQDWIPEWLYYVPQEDSRVRIELQKIIQNN